MTDTADDEFHSISGVLESAEPTSTPTSQHASTPTDSTAPSPEPPTTNGHKPPAAATATAASESGPPASMRHQTLAGVRSLNVSGSPSSATSPLSSRDASPARPPQRPQAPSGTNPKPGFRSRKSSTDVSPSRGPSLAGSSTKTPSAAAIQRALSATSIPELPPASSSDSGRAPRPLKPSSASNSGDNTPHWPISPRLRSPPPGDDGRSRSRANSLRTQLKKSDAQPTPAIVVQSSSPASLSRFPVRDEPVASDPDEPVLSMKGPSRGASGVAPKLETVQESSLPATPGFDGLEVQSFVPSATTHKSSDDERNDVSSSKVTEDLSTAHSNTKNTESGSDGATKADRKGKMQEHQRASSTHRPNTVTSKPSLSSLSNRSRVDPPLRNMTVETETVPSVAQSNIANQDRSASGRVDGSLRLKTSNETIRPKKERKPPKRKAPSINSGTGRLQHISYHYYIPSQPDSGSHSNATSSIGSPTSYRSYDDRRSMLTISPPSPEMRMLSAQPPSFRYFYSATNAVRKASTKADVFEQKVASAVDEANSSDSDATFIYESNPPEHQPHRSRQHHSRTPSMTSVTSLADPRLAIRDAHKNPNKKSSMKFTNPYSNPSIDGDALERGEGTIRVGSGRVGGGSHHHIGRHGQGRGGLGHLVLDSDSSLPQSSRIRGPSSRQASQPNSPRFHTFNVGNGHSNGSKIHSELSSYDMDAENVADDERTPLIPSGRSPRVRTPRRRNSLTLRHLERRHRNNGGWCRRFAGCLVLSILLLVVIFTSVGLIFATTKPLTNVAVDSIQNVVASEDQIVLDLIVNATNPNIIGVTVSDMDVLIFAKSKHVGSDKWWREHGDGKHNNEEDWHRIDISASNGDAGVGISGTDEGNDPIDGEPRTMSLGRIFHFDAPLNFDGSFFQQRRAQSTGDIRLSHPGNSSEAGGKERWEEVLQYPFELIVRGNFKYTLPLSTREHKVPVTASYYYDPDLEKKKLYKVEAKKAERREVTHLVPPKPLGRYDRRALPLLDFE
ncbi:vacuolar segregation subunit 7-domain-containing protein [Pyrenochaeta sp. MPI-SDFR-AT-0127]|nr:vacuolar segregation subunit 7-domain-containing protein [Pyrenochaeta sp. MPI-SDFR-AT-0127]